jgi:cysteine synthase A
MAKYYELTGNDVLMTVATDSAEMYGSRIIELDEQQGPYTAEVAARDYWHHLASTKTDNMEELTYMSRKRIHNLKYYTWVEQQGRTLEELNAQWYDEHYWDNVHKQVEEIDRLTEEFNERTGVLARL